MDFIESLSNLQLDALREIGNIGAGNAASSMAALIDKKIDMDVPSVRVTAFDQVMEYLGGAEKLVVATFIRIQGEAPGTVYFILSQEEAEFFVGQILQDESFTLFEGQQPPNEMAISALLEIGNILSGSYLSALSDFTGINMQPSVPSLSIDMAGAVLTAGLLELSTVTDYALIIDTTITEEKANNRINGHFLLLPDPKSFDKIFASLGIDDYE